MSLILQEGGNDKTLLKTRRLEPSLEIWRILSGKFKETTLQRKQEREYILREI
jgi:hypothetical protein